MSKHKLQNGVDPWKVIDELIDERDRLQRIAEQAEKWRQDAAYYEQAYDTLEEEISQRGYKVGLHNPDNIWLWPTTGRVYTCKECGATMPVERPSEPEQE